MEKEEILKKLEEGLNEMNIPDVRQERMRIFLPNGTTQEDYEKYYGKQNNIEFVKTNKLTINKGE